MTFDHPLWLETVRLIHKFFPESRGLIHHPRDLQFDNVFEMLKTADPAIIRVNRDAALEGSALYQWVLDQAVLTPRGRAVVVPDCGCPTRIPFICSVEKLPERTDESLPEEWEGSENAVRSETPFQTGTDALIVFESGEALLIDHEDGVCWAQTQANKKS